MSELVDQYKTLTAELNQLERQSEKIKGEREVICGQLLKLDGKGHPYDMGDGMPMVVATTKIGTHYMAPKNKWQKSGHPPKPPKAPRQPKVAKEKPPSRPPVRKAIVGGKLVEIPFTPRKSEPPAAQASVPVIPPPAPIPVEAKPIAAAPPPVQQPEPPKAPEPQKPLDPLEAALAELDIE